MITSDQANEILKLAEDYAAAAADTSNAEERGTSAEYAAANGVEQAARQELGAYVRALVMPDTYDAEALRDRVHEINRSSGRVITRDLPEPIRVQPGDTVLFHIEGPGPPRITLADQERSESLRDGLHERTKQDQRAPHHGGH